MSVHRFSSKQIVEAVMHTLEGQDYVVAQRILTDMLQRPVQLDEIRYPVDIAGAKVGSFEKIFQVIFRLKKREKPVLVAFHAARDSFVNSFILADYANQVYLGNVDLRYVHRPLVGIRSHAQDGTTINVYAKEWKKDHLEVHINTKINGTNFILWKRAMGKRIDRRLDTATSQRLAKEIYKILTVYHEINLKRVFINAGDFVAKLEPDGRLDVNLITARLLDDKVRRVGYDHATRSLVVRTKILSFLGDLLALQSQEGLDDEDVLSLQQRNLLGEGDLLPEVRFADFDTVLQGFHEGVRECISLGGAPSSDIPALADTAMWTILSGFADRMDRLDNPYLVEHRAEIMDAIQRYLEKVKPAENRNLRVMRATEPLGGNHNS